MSQPTVCIRCKGSHLVEARFADAGDLRLVVADGNSSPVSARVCIACGAVLITATEPAALGHRGHADPHDVQESDF